MTFAHKQTLKTRISVSLEQNSSVKKTKKRIYYICCFYVYAHILTCKHTLTHAFTHHIFTLSLSLCQFNTMQAINKPKQSSSTTASNKDKAEYTPQKSLSNF